MTLYDRAVRHAQLMAGALVTAIIFVIGIERAFGHSTIAFGVAIVALVIANAGMLQFNCPRCGKNMFFRGIFVIPWPNRICQKCELDLSQVDVP